MGVRFADCISFFLKYPMESKEFGLIETKLFHFHRIFENKGYLKTGGGEGGSSEPPDTPLDPPLNLKFKLKRQIQASIIQTMRLGNA